MEQTKESSGTDPRKQQTMIYICGGIGNLMISKQEIN